jgi:putative ABC transport system permease protein
VLLSEFTLYQLGVRDDAQIEALLGKPLQIDAGGIRTAQSTALVRVLTGRASPEDLSRGQSKAL